MLQLSTGDMLRSAKDADNFGKIKEIMLKGNLVTDEIVIELISDNIDKLKIAQVLFLMDFQNSFIRPMHCTSF